MSTSPAPVEFDETPVDILIPSVPQWLATALIGPAMAGYQAALILFGMYLQSMLRYMVSGEIKQHNRLAQGTLYLMLLLNLLYIGLTFQETYSSGVSNNRSFDYVITGSLQWQFLPWLNGIIGAVAETFLTVRAASFFTNRTAKILFYVWMGSLVTLVVFGSTTTFAVGIVLYNSDDDIKLPIPWNTAVAIWLWASTVADVSITAALTYNLRKRIAGFNRGTDALLRNLIWLGLRSASYTALLSLVGAIVATIWGDSAYRTTEVQIAFWFPIAPLYGLSLLSTTSSGRRMINARVGSVSLGGPLGGTPGAGARAQLSGAFAPATSSFGPRGSSGGFGPGELGAASGTGGARRAGARSSVGAPLQITVRREVHEEEEFDDELDGSVGTGTTPRNSVMMQEKGPGRTRFEV
ncbi:hypothetical protein JCM10450v2_000148 [Rhodotorula kratochvilovae]